MYRIPTTENSELKKRLEENVKHINSQIKVKFIEQTGDTLLKALSDITSVPNKTPCSDFENCIQCKTGDLGKCRISHAVYQYNCLDESCSFPYFGETNRNGY